MNKLLIILCLFFCTHCTAQLSIRNYSMADSASLHLNACGYNLIKVKDLPRGAHAEMMHSRIQVEGNFIRIAGVEHDDGEKDTLNFFDGSNMRISQTIFTYDSCATNPKDSISRFNKLVFLGGKTNKGTLQAGYCHYTLALTVAEILADPEVIIKDPRFKITHLSINYKLRRACDIVTPVELQSGSLVSQLEVIKTMRKGQLIFVDGIQCVASANSRMVYNLCSFTVVIQ